MKPKKNSMMLKLKKHTISDLCQKQIRAGGVAETLEYTGCVTVTSADRHCYTELDCTQDYCPSMLLTQCCTYPPWC